MCDPVKYPPGDCEKVVRGMNDTFQGRSERTVKELLAEVDEVCGRLGIYNEEWLVFRQKVDDFQHQKELLTQPYTKTSNQEYDYEMNHGKKMIDQRLYDQAARDGFPAGFFRGSFFKQVTFYCLPEGQDCSDSIFSCCKFSVCRISSFPMFECCSFHSCEFHSCLIDSANFWNTTFTRTDFHDSSLKKVSFREARMESCNVVDCKLDHIDFLCTKLDGCFFRRVDARRIRNLYTAKIIQSGASEEEVTHNREAIFSALRPQRREQRRPPAKGRAGR